MPVTKKGDDNTKLQYKFYCIMTAILLFVTPVAVSASEQATQYSAYLNRLDRIKNENEIDANGFTIIEHQRFLIEHNNWGQLAFVPAIDRQTGRIVLFFSKEDGSVVFKTDAIASNNIIKGGLNQPNADLPGVAFRDMNGNGSNDIILIINCKIESDPPSARPFRMADVLFQKEDGYFSDRRISDKLNRFGMNSSIDIVTAHVRDKKSTEFLYTSRTINELLENKFNIIHEQAFNVYFEKFGQVDVIPGTYYMAGQYVFIMYLINEEGRIVWNFQPMREHHNFSRIRGLAFQDMDGDGLKDVLVLATYAELGEDFHANHEDDFSIYYQRAGYFSTDTEFRKTYTDDGIETLDSILKKVREFWRSSH